MKKLRIPKVLMIAIVGISLVTASCKKEGCTDPLATNYNKKANHDDGSCEYDGVTPGATLVVTEDVDAPTTWNYERVEVCGNIQINAALTIPEGVTVVMCPNASIEIMESGSMNATGSAANPIVFKGESVSPGYWRGIRFRSNNPNNNLEYVTVSDAGSYWAWDYANVSMGDLAKLSVENSTFSNSEQYGLYANDNATFPSFLNNTFSNNSLAGLNIAAAHAGSIDGASNYNVSNGEDFINVRGMELNSTATWPATTTPMLFVGDFTLSAGINISAGANILMESDAVIDVMETGYLKALGTADAPISIKGRFTSAGYWQGLNIRSNNPNNKFTYVNIADGGSYWAYDYTSVRVTGRLEMDNCSVANSNSWGVVIESSAAIYCSGSAQTDAAGVQSVNTLTGNGAGPDADCVGGGCTITFL
ncbi:MAG: hypothetical protein GQ574_09065 [Crocinitomix sp.]|nr:hypothetical protein [Crocinitomix sp.]